MNVAQEIESPWIRAQIPSVNLSESVHSSWLSGKGGKKKLSLYDACVTDVLNSYIQCAKRLGYMTGRFIGSGPSMESMLARTRNNQTPSPANVAQVVQEAVASTPMFEKPNLNGDKESVQRKRAHIGGTENFSSHRPEFFMESRQRKARGRPRHLFQEEEKFEQNIENSNVAGEERGPMLVEEIEVPREQWALRRMPSHCERKCFGKVGRKNCNNKLQSRDIGLVAPCFWSERAYKDTSITQWLWFCNHEVQHTNAIQKQVKSSPEVPFFWPIAKGTNISNEELSSLRKAGFQVSFFQKPVQRDEPANSIPQVSNSRKRKWRHGISKQAQKRLESAAVMEATFLEEVVSVPGKHVVF